MVIRLVILFGLIAVLITSRLRQHAMRRRAEDGRRANEERVQAAARALDDKFTPSEDGGPQYRDGV
jgi:hypothetical protein